MSIVWMKNRRYVICDLCVQDDCDVTGDSPIICGLTKKASELYKYRREHPEEQNKEC